MDQDEERERADVYFRMWKYYDAQEREWDRELQQDFERLQRCVRMRDKSIEDRGKVAGDLIMLGFEVREGRLIYVGKPTAKTD